MVIALSMVIALLAGAFFCLAWRAAGTDERTVRRFHILNHKLDRLLSLGGQMSAQLDALNTALDDIKTGLAAHGEKLSEIGLDLDDLITQLGSGSTDQAAIDAAVLKAEEIKASIQAESDALDALRTKHEVPAPPPTEPPAEG